MPLQLAANSRRRITVAALTLLLAGGASAQIVLPNQPAPDGATIGGVDVHSSAIALDRMALAVRLEDQKDWKKSAEIYQEIIEKYRDCVVPSAVDDQGVINQFVSVLKRVDEHLCAWPAEGLAVYQSRYQLAAQNLLQSAAPGDLGPVHEVFTRYFITDSGEQAGLKLIDAYFELGDFPAATWIGQELLLHPRLANDRPKVLFRVGLAAHMSGDETAAEKSLKELKDKFPAATGSIGGRDVTFADELAADLSSLHSSDSTTAEALPSSAEAMPSHESGDSFPMFGGNPSRDRTYSSTARPGAKLYSVNLAQPDWRSIADPTIKDIQTTEDPWRKDGSATGVIPVADRGELYFQDNSHLYALSLEAGGPLPAWHATYPDQNGQYTLATDGGPGLAAAKPWNMPTGRQFSVTLTDTAVLAVLGLPDPLVKGFKLAGDQGGVLVCLDRATGKANWTVPARTLADANVKSLNFESSPLVVGDNVFLAVRGGAKSDGYEDCYVVCLDISTGALRWSCYVSSAASTEQALVDNTGGTLPVVDFYAHLAYAGGRVFVSTNLGAIASLDAYSGDIDWVNIYREPGEGVNQGLIMPGGRGFGRGFFRGGGFGGPGGFAGGFNNFAPQEPYAPPTPWTANPPIVHDGFVFVLPDDGKYLLIYDAGDGHLVKKLNKSDCASTGTESQQPKTLVGVLDGALVNDNGQRIPRDVLFVATKDYVCAIKWRDYDAANPHDSLVWATDGVTRDIVGRPFLTTQSVYIPTNAALDRVEIRNGKVAEAYPASSAWPADEGPGNVLVVGEHIVIAGDKHVSVYTDLSAAKSRLDHEVSAAPNDPNPRLHYAEVMFLANEPILATQELDEAIRLLGRGGSAGGSDNDARRRALNDAMDFAVKNWLNNGTDPQSAFLFDRAATLARDPQEQVAYRMARVRFARFTRSGPLDPAAAIKLCQEILADSALASAMVVADFDAPPPPPVQPPDASATPAPPPPPVTERVQAGPAAEKIIAAILADPDGAKAYAPFELAAASEVASAAAAQSADRLAAVAAGYPNSSVAAQARQKAADLYEAKADYAHAAQMLRAIYARSEGKASASNDDGQRLVTLEAMARNYLHMPGRLETAAGRLVAALRIDSGAALVTAMRLPDGRVLSHVQLTDALKAIDPLIDAAAGPNDLPVLSLPSRAAKQEYFVKFNQSVKAMIADPAVPSIPNIGALLAPDEKFARYDRLATWTSGAGLSIYPVGKNQPLGTDADFTDEPSGAAWVNGRADLLAWGGSTVMLVAGEKPATRWRIDLTALPRLDVVAQAPPQQAQPSLIQPINQQRLRMMTRRGPVAPNQPLFQLNPFGATSPPSDNSDSASAGATVIERVSSVTPAVRDRQGRGTSDIAVVSTTTGRAAAIDTSTGHVIWEFRLLGRPLDRVLVTDDFTVLKASDSVSVHLAILDTHTGRLLARRDFASDDSACPVNIALGDDGSFAFSTTDIVNIFDLFEADRDPGLTHPVSESSSDGTPHYAGLSKPDQLIIDDGMAVALSDRGQILRGFSLRTGQPREALGTEGGTEDSALRPGGKYLYAWGPAAIEGVNLNKPEASWPPSGYGEHGLAHQLLLGKDFLLILSQPFGQVDSKTWWVSAFSRAIVPPSNTESGLLVHQFNITDPTGIRTWQLVDGGVCCLGGDNVLHLLRGNINPAPPPPPKNAPSTPPVVP